MTDASNKARYFPATRRNRSAIAKVLKRHLPISGTILEIGSGSGEHGLFFAKLFPYLDWQPSDPDPLNIDSINAWIDARERDVPNLRRPLNINASDLISPIDLVSAILCINVIHIAPWSATEGLMCNSEVLLPPGGILYLYGPYKIDGKHTSLSNESFDLSLRSQNKNWGVRNMEDICAEAKKHGLMFSKKIEMPSNNLSLIFKKYA